MSGARKILGAMDLRILFVHIAPNILPPIAFVAVLDVARMMIFEAIFGFIGIGIQPPTPTFGTIIADGTKYLINAWWITTIPGSPARHQPVQHQPDGRGARAGAQQAPAGCGMSASKTVLEVKDLSVELAARERPHAPDSQRRDLLARGRSGDRHHRRKRVGKDCPLAGARQLGKAAAQGHVRQSPLSRARPDGPAGARDAASARSGNRLYRLRSRQRAGPDASDWRPDRGEALRHQSFPQPGRSGGAGAARAGRGANSFAPAALS